MEHPPEPEFGPSAAQPHTSGRATTDTKTDSEWIVGGWRGAWLAVTHHKASSHDTSGAPRDSATVPRVKPPGGFTFVALIVFALSGCGGSDDGTRDADPNPPVSPSTSSKAALPKTSVCEDKEGDGGAVDLLSASIRNRDDEVLLSAELAGPIPQTNDVWVGFHVQSADFQVIRQVAMRWTDGRMVKPDVYEDSTRGMANLRLSPSDVEVDGNTVTLTGSWVTSRRPKTGSFGVVCVHRLDRPSRPEVGWLPESGHEEAALLSRRGEGSRRHAANAGRAPLPISRRYDAGRNAHGSRQIRMFAEPSPTRALGGSTARRTH